LVLQIYLIRVSPAAGITVVGALLGMVAVGIQTPIEGREDTAVVNFFLEKRSFLLFS
jgi:hypothetical protein